MSELLYLIRLVTQLVIIYFPDHEAEMEEMKTEHEAALRKKETQVYTCRYT